MKPQSRTRHKPQLREKYINNKKEKTISKNLKNNDKTTFFCRQISTILMEPNKRVHNYI